MVSICEEYYRSGESLSHSGALLPNRCTPRGRSRTQTAWLTSLLDPWDARARISRDAWQVSFITGNVSKRESKGELDESRDHDHEAATTPQYHANVLVNFYEIVPANTLESLSTVNGSDQRNTEKEHGKCLLWVFVRP